MIDIDLDDNNGNEDEYVIIETETKIKLNEADKTKTYIIDKSILLECYFTINESDWLKVALNNLVNSLDYKGKQIILREYRYRCHSKRDCDKSCLECNTQQVNPYDKEFFLPVECLIKIEYDGQWDAVEYMPKTSNPIGILNLCRLQANKWYSKEDIVDACSNWEAGLDVYINTTLFQDGLGLEDYDIEATFTTCRLHHNVDIFAEENKIINPKKKDKKIKDNLLDLD